MSEPIAVFLWWLVIQILGLAVWPLLTRWLRWLPDRGYMLAKPIGLLFVAYGVWILATLGRAAEHDRRHPRRVDRRGGAECVGVAEPAERSARESAEFLARKMDVVPRV